MFSRDKQRIRQQTKFHHSFNGRAQLGRRQVSSDLAAPYRQDGGEI
jgi:hypothetical protein